MAAAFTGIRRALTAAGFGLLLIGSATSFARLAFAGPCDESGVSTPNPQAEKLAEQAVEIVGHLRRASASSCQAGTPSLLCRPLTPAELARARADFQKRLQSKMGNLSGEVRVSVQGTPLGATATGYARREGKDRHQWPAIDESTLFPVASVTKAVVATLVWKRIQEGKLGIDQTLESLHMKFWPSETEFPAQAQAWKKITIRQLLQHTSGLPDHALKTTLDRATEERWDNHRVIAEMQKGIRSNPQRLPDHYSNTGYLILGEILESPELNGGKAKPLGAQLADEIFKPLDMKSTALLRDNHLGAGYAYPAFGLRSPESELREPHLFHGAGDIRSTAPDLEKWLRGVFVEKRILNPSTLEQMLAHPTPRSHYTAGFTQDPTRVGYSLYYKTGGFDLNYIHEVAWVPEYGISVVVLQNGYTRGRFIQSIAQDAARQAIEAIEKSRTLP